MEKKIAKLKEPISKKYFTNKIYIYGSDEIWNFSNKIFKFDPHYFGNSNINKSFAYACSFGNSKIENLKKKIYF